ncbi:bile acid/sodium symporter family protein [Caenibius tardaugens NBRC 16725]|uniref:Bile acid/sodium symporter family protein n=1 Tax=Caenibius tardaugens NBRC 16725 TaxID=1219035 RepID=U2YAB4_9SPHN|nr:bile acid:sodium symporter family protein [Caenibius tardaugens]GAD50301.1 bile acid/sodium symporter family protein [Caenibius tardaugens NBRC 16725]
MKALLARFHIDTYLLMLIGTVVLASVLPARGAWAPIAGGAADAGIVLLFFLHGARLSRQAVLDGARNWKLHLAVVAMTFLVFPILGLGIYAIPGIEPELAIGLLFLTLLPSTVQSSIGFTAVAQGNVAAAVCSATFSNLAGIFITPLLVALLITGKHGGVSTDMIVTIAVQLLLPFLAGHFLRPWIGGWVTRQKRLLAFVDKGSILLVVYTAFGAAVVDGLWQRVAPRDLTIVMLICCVLLTLVLVLSYIAARVMKLPREDAIVLQFCGSKKSLASGVPMASVLFATSQVGAILLPVVIFHQIQLMVCAVLAQRYRAAAERARSAAEPATAPAIL